jgi:glutamate 5-kinase
MTSAVHRHPRQRIASASRLVVKVGSSSLTGPDGGLAADRLEALVAVLAERRLAGCEVVLGTSGAIACAIDALGLAARPRDLATQQAAAAVGQGLLMAHYTASFASHGLVVGQVLLTAEDMVRRSHHRNAARTLNRLFGLGVVPIVNENDTVATDEIRFGDNDRLAALVAHLVHADGLALLSDVESLYTAPPSRPGARAITDVRSPADLAGVAVGGSGPVGRGGMTTKLEAARIATEAGVPVVLAAAAQAGAAIAGEEVGTVFHPTGRRAPTRLLWLAHASTPRGRLLLDAGAVAAVAQRRASLLPAGVISVEGDFSAGDPVELLDESRAVVARGLVNFDAEELPSLLGRSTRDLARERGSAYEREVVHRDDLVLLNGFRH